MISWEKPDEDRMILIIGSNYRINTSSGQVTFKPFKGTIIYGSDQFHTRLIFMINLKLLIIYYECGQFPVISAADVGFSVSDERV